MTKRDKVTVDEVIGLIHTDKPTDSVEEVCKLRGRTNERFELVDIGFIYDNDKLIGMKEIVDLLNQLNYENEQLKKDATILIYANQDYRHENEHLKSENKRLTDKLNETALEFLNYDMVTMGKATEISEMCYSDFLKFRKENGNPMELQK